MTKQWLQMSLIWLGVLVSAMASYLYLEGEARFAVFSAIAASAIAVVSLEHLISSKSKDTVRQQVYVSAGTIFLLVIFTVLSLIS
jgi:hypothetical protein